MSLSKVNIRASLPTYIIHIITTSDLVICLIELFVYNTLLLFITKTRFINFLSKASRRVVRPVAVGGGSSIKPAGHYLNWGLYRETQSGKVKV